MYSFQIVLKLYKIFARKFSEWKRSFMSPYYREIRICGWFLNFKNSILFLLSMPYMLWYYYSRELCNKPVPNVEEVIRLITKSAFNDPFREHYKNPESINFSFFVHLKYVNLYFPLFENVLLL